MIMIIIINYNFVKYFTMITFNIDNHYQLESKKENSTKVEFLRMCVNRILQFLRFFVRLRHILLNCRKLD